MKWAAPAVVIILTLAGALTASQAQTSASTGEEVDRYVSGELKEQRIPGIALAVVKDGHVLKAQGYGLANVELDVPVIPETVFQTDSVGKQFTATAVMMLVEQGKIGLDDPISKYFPSWPSSWKDITVRRLLTHTSGIPDYTEKIINLRQDYTENQLLRKFETLPLNFAPGQKWSYSNTGYVILGILIRKVTGQFYGDFLNDHIFQPLGMNTTRIISEADIVPNRAAGYRLVKGQLKNQEWVSPPLNTTADGALYTTALDMAKWDAALYTEKLLKESSLQQMWTPVTLNDGSIHHYGFGWDVSERNGHRLFEHGGAWQGFTTHIARYVDDRLSVIVLTNLDSEHSNPGKIAHHIAGMYVPEVRPQME
jgi:CubicO group peptidase (beta-lactamase class C family)